MALTACSRFPSTRLVSEIWLSMLARRALTSRRSSRCCLRSCFATPHCFSPVACSSSGLVEELATSDVTWLATSSKVDARSASCFRANTPSSRWASRTCMSLSWACCATVCRWIEPRRRLAPAARLAASRRALSCSVWGAAVPAVCLRLWTWASAATSRRCSVSADDSAAMARASASCWSLWARRCASASRRFLSATSACDAFSFAASVVTCCLALDSATSTSQLCPVPEMVPLESMASALGVAGAPPLRSAAPPPMAWACLNASCRAARSRSCCVARSQASFASSAAEVEMRASRRRSLASPSRNSTSAAKPSVEPRSSVSCARRSSSTSAAAVRAPSAATALRSASSAWRRSWALASVRVRTFRMRAPCLSSV